MSLLHIEDKGDRRKHYDIYSLPSDVLLRCIAPYLYKWDQYQWLSTCKSHMSLLLHIRTLRITDRIPSLRDASVNKYLSMNVYLWKRFLKGDLQRLLKALGCIHEDESNDTNTNVRKIRLDIGINELVKHKEVVLSIAEYLSHLCIEESKGSSSHSYPSYNFPKNFKNPTAPVISRWLQASDKSFYNNANSERSCLQIIHEYVEKVNAELGKYDCVNTQIISWSALRGANKVTIESGNQCYVELGADSDVCLQSITFIYCKAATIEVPDVCNITIKHCPNVINFDLVSVAVNVYLEGLTVPDLRMLGKCRQLTVKKCKVLHYPVPAFGKGQAWEFYDVDLVDVSAFKSLEKLLLINCTCVKDCRMLGNVLRLSIEKGDIQNYPVPRRGKRQYWVFSKVDISDVSRLASLHCLTLRYCNAVTDISMLGSVKYLTIEGCAKLSSNEQFPVPAGRLQEWTFKHMDMQKIQFKTFANLHHLTVDQCRVKDIVKLVSTKTFRNMKVLDLRKTKIRNTNILVSDGKVQIVDKSTLSTAVLLWCHYEAVAKIIYGDIEQWDVSKVKDMSNIFEKASMFNGHINTWDVSNVTNMSLMFDSASSFNQPLDSWNVSNVSDMKYMFHGARSFNQPLDSWNVSNVTNMNYMFNGAASFNQPLDSWNVSNVPDMNYIFSYGAPYRPSWYTYKYW